jgi:hypothetical protein
MNHIYETLKKLIRDEQRKSSYIYLDEKDNQIKATPLRKLDSSASAYINNTIKNINPIKLIHDSIINF